MKSFVPAGAVITAALVLGAAPAAQADDGVNSNVITSNALQKIANHPTVLQNNGGSDGHPGNAAGSVIDTLP
ncbi:hypothetical protein ACFWCB_22665 [Streptomyces sp. NPDC060048]|uniref:hypothetical protein n=1 Tax=unclassified Streptomyces TaxID=2593676 RepID=UPI0036B5258A